MTHVDANDSNAKKRDHVACDIGSQILKRQRPWPRGGRLICEQKILKNRSYSREEAIIGFPLLKRYKEVSANNVPGTLRL